MIQDVWTVCPALSRIMITVLPGPKAWPLALLLGLTLLALSCFGAAGGLAQEVLIQEDFQSLDAWEPFAFKDIEKKTRYEIVISRGESLLKASSNSSASALVHSKTFDVYQFPLLSWRWKVERVYERGNATVKQGDDYPLRVYVLFEYDPDQAGLARRLKYALAKTLHGEYPPDSSLNYIWANQRHAAPFLINPYAEQARMIPLQFGGARAGEWQEESRNILKDYETAFGRQPPVKAALAIMNDSDDTGEAGVSYLDWIRVEAGGGE